MGTVVSLEELILQRRLWEGNSRRLVLVVGCFDLLHPGHIRFLEQARDYGQIEAVGVLSDASVAAFAKSTRAYSSVKRPITPATERCEILAALAMVDFVFALNDSEPPDVVTRLAPDVVVLGSDASPFAATVRQAAEQAGVEVVRIPHEPGHSTLALIERITQLRA